MNSKTPFIGCAAVLLSASAVVLAHTDDPKGREIPPLYTGPGYSEADSVAGGGIAIFPNSNILMRSWVTIPTFGDHSFANDCWGYTSPSGREYAILGLSNGTSFVEITNPGIPTVLGSGVPGPYSTWRDIKTYQQYAYIVSEGLGQAEGLQVVDLTGIDDGQVVLQNVVTTGGSAKSHNVVIDEASGFLYRCGGAGNGLRIYDLADPVNPVFVGEWPDRYVHDCEVVTMTDGPWAGRQIAFTCGGFNNGWNQTGLDILDVTDKQDIISLARYLYPGGEYSHQATLSADRQYLFLDDEFDENYQGVPTTMHVIDVSDLENPFEATTFTNGLAAITHNHYCRGNYVFAANYSSGLRAYDVSNPLEPSEVGYFDTQPQDTGTNFNGLWSNFPYFPSGTVIGSDRANGLFVLTPTFEPGNPADVNGDGVVGVDDLVAVISNWGPCPPPCPPDVTGDGVVDVNDIVALFEAWET